MGAGIERLKVICHQKDGRRKRAPVSASQRDKRSGKYVCVNETLRSINDFISPEQKP